MKIVNLHELPELPVSHEPKIKKKVMIEKGVIPKLTNFTQSVFKPGDLAPAHKHADMYEAFLVEEGEGLFKVNGEERKVKKGDCILIELNDEHEVSNPFQEILVLTYFGIEK